MPELKEGRVMDFGISRTISTFPTHHLILTAFTFSIVIMARFAAALGLLLTATTAVAFCPVQSAVVSRRGAVPRLGAAEDTDFDAPVPQSPQSGTAVLEREPIVDDECYMGKDGGADECVDFDPSPPRTTRSANAHDRPRSTPRWTVAEDLDFDAPVPAYPMSGTAVLDSLPIVDDECYMGKEGGGSECVDFDPYSPRRTTRSANAQDRPRSSPRWASFLSRSGLPETSF